MQHLERDFMNAHESHFERLLDAVEAAEHLRIHPKTLLKMARMGHVPCIRIGRYIRFRLSALDVWVCGSDNHRSQPFA